MKRIYFFLLLFSSFLFMTSCYDEERHALENTDIASTSANNSGLSVLAIGNSFTDDATRHLPQIMNAFEEKDIFFAKIVKGGTSLQDHWENISSSAKEYVFYFNKYSFWVSAKISTVKEAIELTDWDYVVLQQLSTLSVDYDSYQPYLNDLISIIKKNCPDTKIVWQMTWAYSSATCNREEMYNSIVAATEKVSEVVDIVIPSGRVIEELRESEYNDDMDLTRDGRHLNKGFPCFALSCLWHEYLITPYTHESCVTGNEEKISKLLSNYQ